MKTVFLILLFVLPFILAAIADVLLARF